MNHKSSSNKTIEAEITPQMVARHFPYSSAQYIVLINRIKNYTLKSIGQELGITRERTRQIEQKALLKILK